MHVTYTSATEKQKTLKILKSVLNLLVTENMISIDCEPCYFFFVGFQRVIRYLAIFIAK